MCYNISLWRLYMEVLSFFGKGIASNTFLLINQSDAVIIDASTYDPIVNVCNERNLNVRAILLTHGHFDHTLELSRLKETFNAPIYINNCDAEMLINGYLSAYNVFFQNFHYDQRPKADCLILDNSQLNFGSISLSCMSLPGHTSGSTIFYTDDIMFTGDILFASSIGRCDLPSGDDSAMSSSLDYFKALPYNYQIYSGHGANADLKYIKKYNYYLGSC